MHGKARSLVNAGLVVELISYDRIADNEQLYLFISECQDGRVTVSYLSRLNSREGKGR